MRGLLAQSGTEAMPVVIPISGTTTVPRLEENIHTDSLTLEELKRIDDILASM